MLARISSGGFAARRRMPWWSVSSGASRTTHFISHPLSRFGASSSMQYHPDKLNLNIRVTVVQSAFFSASTIREEGQKLPKLQDDALVSVIAAHVGGIAESGGSAALREEERANYRGRNNNSGGGGGHSHDFRRNDKYQSNSMNNSDVKGNAKSYDNSSSNSNINNNNKKSKRSSKTLVGENISFDLESINTAPQALDALEYYSQRGDVDSVIKLFGSDSFADLSKNGLNYSEALSRCITTMEHMGLHDALVALAIEQEKLNRLSSPEIWDTIISSLSKVTLSDQSISLYKSYMSRGFRFSDAQLMNIGRGINVQTPVRLMLDFLNLLFEMNHILPNHILHHLIFICSLKKQNDLAVHFVELMNDMRGKDLTVYALDECLSACQSVGDHQGCLRIIKLMNQRGIKRHASWIIACLSIGDYDGAVAAISDAHSIGSNPGENMYFSLIEKLNSVGRISDIEKVITRLVYNNSKDGKTNIDRDIMVKWSRALELWRYIGQNEKVESMLTLMINSGFDPNILNLKQQLGLSQLHLKNTSAVEDALREKHAKGEFKSYSRFCSALLCCSESSNYELAKFLFDKNIGQVKEKLFTDFPECNERGAMNILKLPVAHKSLMIRALGELHFICRRQKSTNADGYSFRYSQLIRPLQEEFAQLLDVKSYHAVLFHSDMIRSITARGPIHADSADVKNRMHQHHIDISQPLAENHAAMKVNSPDFPLTYHYNMVMGYYFNQNNLDKVIEVFDTINQNTKSKKHGGSVSTSVQPNYRSLFLYQEAMKQKGMNNKLLETASEYAILVLQTWKANNSTVPVEFMGFIGILSSGLETLTSQLSNVTIDKKNVDDIMLHFEMLLVIIKAIHTLGFPTKGPCVDLVVEVCNKLLSFPGKTVNFESFYNRAYNLVSVAIIEGQPFNYNQIRTFIQHVIKMNDHAKVCELFELNPVRFLYSIVIDHKLLASVLHSLDHQKRNDVIVQTISIVSKQRNTFSLDVFSEKNIWGIFVPAWCAVFDSALEAKDEVVATFLHDSFSMVRKCADAHNLFLNLDLALYIAHLTLDGNIPKVAVDILDDILQAKTAEIKRHQLNLNDKAAFEVQNKFNSYDAQIKQVCSKLEDLFLKQKPESGDKSFIEVLDRYDAIKEGLLSKPK